MSERLSDADVTQPGTLTDDRDDGAPASEHAPRYEIVGEVGRGGIGVVLRAIDRKLGRTIALKVISGDAKTSIARFEAEARITARLEHPGIVPVYDVGRLGGAVPFYAMKLSGGRTLAAAIEAAADLGARLPLVGAVLAVADAIAYAHSRDVIHRDLKPANVLVGEFGEIMVIDWGLAKERLGADDGYGVVVGTPAFMPPEQALGERLDFRADVFAIGAILHNVLSGRPLRRGGSVEMLADAVSTPITPIEQVIDGVPTDLAAICARALAHDRDARYPTARELADDLRRFQNGRLVSARRYTAVERLGRWLRRHRALVAMATLSIVLLATIGGVSLARVIAARRRAENESARLLLEQARATIDRDPATALAWLERLLASPGRDAVALEDVRVLVADARSRGVAHYAIDGADNFADLDGTADGHFAISLDLAEHVKVWDLERGVLRTDLPGPFRAFAIAPDGASFATVDDAGVTLRDLDGAPARTIAGADAAVGFTRDGGVIVVGRDGAVTAPGGARLALDAPITLVHGLADGRIAFAGPTLVGVWDPGSGAVSRLSCEAPSRLSVAPDGAQIALSSTSGSGTNLYDVGAAGITLREHGEFGNVSLGDHGAIAWGTRTVITMRARSDDLATEIPSPEDAMIAFAGPRLVGANNTNHLYVLDELPVRAHGVARRQTAVRYVKAMDGGRDAFMTIGGEIGVVDGSGAVTTYASDQRYYGGDTVAMLPVGDTIVFGATTVWKVDRGGAPVELWNAPLACIARLPSGEVALISTDGHLRTYDASVTRVVRQLDVEPSTRECIAGPDGTIALSVGDGAISLIDATTGVERARDASPDGAAVEGLAVTPDGTIVSSDFGGSVRAWRPGAPSRVLFHQDSPVWSVAISPDGQWIASGGRDRRIRISDRDGHVVEILRGHGDEVSHVTFDPDGTLTSSGMDGTILRWTIDPTRSPPSDAAALDAHIRGLTAVGLRGG